MPERFIHHVGFERPAPAETAAQARERLREKFPRTTSRRMTHLGLLIGSALDAVVLTPEDAIVYASIYAETRALEDFLETFPAASPLLFQTSIHPGGVQQVLIGRQQPVGRLWPLAGGARIVEAALLTALLEPAPRVALIGGEERGTWLLEHGVASDRSFAFAAVLTNEPAGAAGRVAFAAAGGPAEHAAGLQGGPDGTCPMLAEFADALAGRADLRWPGAGGRWSLEWS